MTTNKDLPNDINTILHDVRTNYVITPDLNIYKILEELYGNVRFLSFADRMKLTTVIALVLGSHTNDFPELDGVIKPIKPVEPIYSGGEIDFREARIFYYLPVYLDDEFRVVVVDRETEEWVFEHSGDELVMRGFMRDSTDLEGLRGFLIHIGELLDQDVLKMDRSL